MEFCEMALGDSNKTKKKQKVSREGKRYKIGKKWWIIKEAGLQGYLKIPQTIIITICEVCRITGRKSVFIMTQNHKGKIHPNQTKDQVQELAEK